MLRWFGLCFSRRSASFVSASWLVQHGRADGRMGFDSVTWWLTSERDAKQQAERRRRMQVFRAASSAFRKRA